MVVPLRPGKFYGSSLPRPRFYTDVKFSDERVDPPKPVLDPLMSWANEAHWSMGGLSRDRVRLQGKIEGNVKKLKKEREHTFNLRMENETPVSESKKGVGNQGRKGDSPPPAPVSKKRRRRVVREEEADTDESEEEEVEVKVKSRRRRLVRKLGDDFELVGGESERNGGTPLKEMRSGEASEGISSRTRMRTRMRPRRSMVLMEEEEDEEEEGGDNDGKSGKGKKKGKAEKTEGKTGSVSPNMSRSSPRLKKKLG